MELKIVLQKRESQISLAHDYVANIISSEKNPIKLGSGLSVDIEIAKKRAIYEALERFYSSKKPKNIYQSSIKNLKNKKIIFWTPDNIIYKNSETIDWVEGWSFYQKQKIMIPAEAVYLKYGKNSDSTGVAIHESFTKAVRNGILEIIEREAFIDLWLNKVVPLQIDLTSINSYQIEEIIKAVNKEGLELIVFISPNKYKIISTISVIYDRHGQIPSASFGSAAGLNLSEVVKKSLEEALMIRNTINILKNKKLFKMIAVNKVRTPIDRILFYSFPENNKYWKFLLKSRPRKIKIKSFPKKSLRSLISQICADGQELIVVKLHPDNLEDKNLHLVRILMPMINTAKIKKINKAPLPFG